MAYENIASGEGQSQIEMTVREELCKLSGDQPVNVLVLGKPGVGKSSFINSMHMALAHRWREVANYGDGSRAVTTELVRYEMFRDELMTECPIVGYNHNVFFWDTAGLEDLEDEIFETFLGLIMEGRVPPDTNFHKYTPDSKTSPKLQTVRNLEKKFPGPGEEANKCHRIVFICAANEEPPRNLMRSVLNAGAKDRAHARNLPIYLLMSKCDLVTDANRQVYESRKKNAAEALSVAGNPQRCKEMSLYCTELTGPEDPDDYLGMKRNEGIDKKLLHFWMNLLDASYRVKYEVQKTAGRKGFRFSFK